MLDLLTILTEAFSSLGLPIAIIVVLIFIVYQMGKRMNEQADANMLRVQERCKEREDKLLIEIEKCREINEKAIDTIARYAEKLDNIQNDVREIKQDMALMMMNGGHSHNGYGDT